MSDETPTRSPALTVADVKKILAESSPTIRAELKSIFKEAFNEWVKDIKASVGTWTIRAAFTLLLGWLGYLYLTGQGWTPPTKP